MWGSDCSATPGNGVELLHLLRRRTEALISQFIVSLMSDIIAKSVLAKLCAGLSRQLRTKYQHGATGRAVLVFYQHKPPTPALWVSPLQFAGATAYHLL